MLTKPVLLLVAALAVATPRFTLAIPDNPCTAGWSGPQTSMTCDFGEQRQWLIEKVGSALALAVVGLIVFVFTFLTCCGRYVCSCCGSAKQRPGHVCCGGEQYDDLPEDDIKVAYDARFVMFTKALTVIVLILSICAVAISFAGAGNVAKLPTVLLNGFFDFAEWVIGIADRVLNGLSSTNPSFSQARSQIADVKTQMASIKTQGNDYSSRFSFVAPIMLGLSAPTIVVCVGGVAGVMAALFHVRNYLPAVVILLTMVVAVPVGVLGSAAGVLNIPMKVWCDEVDAQKARAPGLFQWYLVPQWCNSAVSFPALRVRIDNEIAGLVNSTCNDLASRCDSAPAYGPSGNYFVCSTAPTCTTTQGLVNVLSAMTLKTGIPAETGCNGCTVQQCVTTCTSSVQSTAASLWNNATDANNAYNVVTSVLNEYADCNVIVDKLLGFFDLCSTLHSGLKSVYAGAAIGITTCILLIINMFLGQKRFFKPSDFNKEQADMQLISRF